MCSKFAAVLIVVVSSACSSAEQAVDTSGLDDRVDASRDGGETASPSFAAVDWVVTEERARQAIPGVAVGIAKRGEVRYLAGYGYADVAAKTLVEPSRTLFRWASISKTLAGIVMAQLADEGVVDLDANISDYYKEYTRPDARLVQCKGAVSITVKGVNYTCVSDVASVPLLPSDGAVTLHRLAAHTAGIQHYENGESDPSPPWVLTLDKNVNTGMEWALAYLIKQPLVNAPGERSSYTTFGANLAGVVLEKRSGSTFESMVSARIATKVGMRSLAADYAWVSRSDLATGYMLSRGVSVAVPALDNSWKLAGGGYLSTVEDMTKYCAAFYGTSLLTDAHKKLAWAEQTTNDGTKTNHGLFFSLGTANGRAYVGHAGSNSWTATRMRYYPDDGLCIAVMANLYDANTARLLTRVEDAARTTGI